MYMWENRLSANIRQETGLTPFAWKYPSTDVVPESCEIQLAMLTAILYKTASN